MKNLGYLRIRLSIAPVRLAIPFILIGLVTISGCSHTRPYYRGGLHPSPQPLPESNELRFRLLLAGDAGAPREDEPNLDLMTEWAAKNPEKTLVIFLGDFLYDNGMPVEQASDRREMERRIQAQIDVIKNSGCRGFFVAGNHDWWQGAPGLQRAADYIEAQLGTEDGLLPPAGWIGPAIVDVENIRILTIDSNLWINPHLQPVGSSPQQTLEDSLADLKDALLSAGNRIVVVAAHHPLDSHGSHGGFYDWKDHLFPLTAWIDWLWVPLPIIGSLHPWLRWNVVRHYEELNSARYKQMIEAFGDAFGLKKPLLYAAGHDHALQVLEGESVDYILVSGAGIDSRLSKVTDGSNTLFAHLHTGFMAVDFLQDGEIWLYVVEPGLEEVVFAMRLEKQSESRR